MDAHADRPGTGRRERAEVDGAADEWRRRALGFEEAYLYAGRFQRMVRAEAAIMRMKAKRRRSVRRSRTQ